MATAVAVEKLLPQSVDAEAGALGSILIDPLALTEIAGLVQPDDFYREAHRTIYASMLDLRASGVPVDLITLTDELGRIGKLDDIGGVSAVSALANQVPTSANADYYARIVADKALLRRVIHFAGQMAAIAYNEADADAVIEEGAILWQNATLRYGGADSADIADALDTLLAGIEQAMETGIAPGLTTGFRALDDHLLGLQRAEVTYLVGRPGSGKSAIAKEIAQHVAATDQGPVEWVSLEMNRTQQAKRILTSWAGIDGRIIRGAFIRPDGSVDHDSYQRAKAAAAEIRRLLGGKLRLYDKPLSMRALRTYAQRAVYKRGCKLLVVDYIGLLDGDNPKESDYARISAISRQMKALALELNIHILCLVQMNRDAEKRQDKRPQMSDLRDSGGLEQDPDVILGVYRGAYYDAARAATDAYFREYAELLVLKVREGVANVSIPLRFEGEYTRPSDWPEDWPIPTENGGAA